MLKLIVKCCSNVFQIGEVTHPSPVEPGLQHLLFWCCVSTVVFLSSDPLLVKGPYQAIPKAGLLLSSRKANCCLLPPWDA